MKIHGRMLLVLLFLVISPQATAQSKVISEYLLVLAPQHYNNFVNEGLKEWNGKIREELKNENFDDPFKTSISGISLTLDFNLKLPDEPIKEGLYPFQAEFNQTTIAISKVSTKDSQKRRVGSATINISIDGSCKGIVLKHTDKNSLVSGEVRLLSKNGKAELVLENYDFDFNPNRWMFSVKGCKGPKGYDRVVKSYILEYLNDPKNIAAAIEDGINSQLRLGEQEINKEIIQAQSFKIIEGMNLKLHPQRIDIQSSGEALVRGFAIINFENTEGGEVYVSFKKPADYVSESSQIVLPKDIVPTISNALHNNGFYRKHLVAQEIPELKDFFKSRFKQFFAWPDLREFSKSADFRFDISTLATPSLSELANWDGQLHLNANVHLINQMLAPKGLGHRPYVNFYSAMAARMSLGITPFGGQLKFSKARINSNYQFDPLYVRENKPNQKIDIEAFEEKLEEALEEEVVDFELGPIELEESGKIYPSEFVLVDGHPTLIYTKTGVTPSNGRSNDNPLVKVDDKPKDKKRRQVGFSPWSNR